MSAPLPNALRTRFRKYIEEGLSGRGRFGPLAMPIPHLRGLRVAKESCRRIGPFFEELIVQDPYITLFELRDALAQAKGVRVHHSSIANLLARLGFTYKKVAGCHRAPSRQSKAATVRLV